MEKVIGKIDRPLLKKFKRIAERDDALDKLLERIATQEIALRKQKDSLWEDVAEQVNIEGGHNYNIRLSTGEVVDSGWRDGSIKE